MNRVRTILPLVLGVSLATGASVAANAACQLQSAGGQHQARHPHHLRQRASATDNPRVPSDLEQMPNLLNFLLKNGVVSGNHHTPLISHTAT